MTRVRTPQAARGALIAATLALAACAGDVPPPTAQMGATSQAILNAERAGADRFAPLELERARAKMVAADDALRRDERETARRLAEQAQVDADLAASRAQSAAAQQAAGTVNRDLQTLRGGTANPGMSGSTGTVYQPSGSSAPLAVPAPVPVPDARRTTGVVTGSAAAPYPYPATGMPATRRTTTTTTPGSSTPLPHPGATSWNTEVIDPGQTTTTTTTVQPEWPEWLRRNQ